MLEFTTGLQDRLAAVRWLGDTSGYSRRRIRRFRRLNAFAAATIGILGGVLWAGAGLRLPRPSVSLTAFGIAVVLGAAAWLASGPWARARLERELREGLEPGAVPDTRLRVWLEPGGLVVASSRGEEHHAWHAVRQAELTDSHAMVWLHAVTVLAVPRSVDPTAVAWFAASVQAGANTPEQQADTESHPPPPVDASVTLEFDVSMTELRQAGLWLAERTGDLAVRVRQARRHRLSMTTVMALPVVGLVGFRVARGLLDPSLLWLVLGLTALALARAWVGAGDETRSELLDPTTLERLLPQEVSVWQRISLTPRGVIVEDEHSLTCFVWPAIEAIEETAELLLFRAAQSADGSARAYAIPKRIGPATVAEFARLMRGRGLSQ